MPQRLNADHGFEPGPLDFRAYACDRRSMQPCTACPAQASSRGSVCEINHGHGLSYDNAGEPMKTITDVQ